MILIVLPSEEEDSVEEVEAELEARETAALTLLKMSM